MSNPAGNNQDLDSVGILLLVVTAGMVVLYLLMLLVPILLLAFLLAELFLFLLFKEHQYVLTNALKILAVSVSAFLLILSLPSNAVVEKFQGFGFMFFNEQIPWFIKKYLNFSNHLLPKKMAINYINGIQLRIYLWLSLPVAGIISWLKIKKRVPPIFRFHFLNAKAQKLNRGNSISIGVYKNKFFNPKFKISYDMLKHHLHVLGASGFGKSVFLSHLVADLIRKNRGLMFVDLKADIETVRQVTSLAKESNRIDKLKFFSCANPEFSSYYNVLARGNANQLTDRIISSLIWSEEFYKNECKSILIKIMIPLVWIRDNTDHKPHLGDLLLAVKNPDYVCTLKTKISPDRIDILSNLEEVDRYLREKDLFRNIQGLRAQLESIILTDFGAKLCPESNPSADCSIIDIYTAVKNTEIIYFLLDSRRYSESAKSLGRMILEDLKATSAEIDSTISTDKRQAFNIIIDEFADMASDDFIGFLDRARSSGMGTCLAHQEISDLKRISPEMADRLMHLTSTTICFLTKLPDSAEKISAMAGTRTAFKTTEKAQTLFGVNIRSGDISLREVEEFNIHPNILKNLTVGEAVVIGKYPTAYCGVIKINPPEELKITDLEFTAELQKISASIQNLKTKPPVLNLGLNSSTRESIW